MILNKLSIQGFKSFGSKKELSFDLFKVGGLYYITGTNEVEPHLGANGTGKSTLWDSVCWVFYGKDTKGLSAGNVRSWTSKQQCKVIIEFSHNKEGYTLLRSWKPNLLTLNGKVVTQEQLIKLIDLDYSSFLYSIVIGQFTPQFFDLGAEAKLQVFTDILDLDKWLSYSKKADSRSKDIDKEILEAQKDISNKEGQVDSVGSQDFEEQINEWEKERSVNILRYRNGIKGNREQIQQIGNELLEKKSIFNDLGNSKEVLLEKRVGLVTEEKMVNGILQKSKEGFYGLKAELRQVQKSLDKFQVIGNVCITCEQPVPKSYVRKQLRIIRSAAKVLEVQEKDTNNNVKVTIKVLEKVQDDLDFISEELVSVRMEHQKVDNALFNLADRSNRLKKDIEKWRKDIKYYREQKNPFKEMSYKNKIRINGLQKEIKKLNKLLEDLEKKYEVSKYWIKGFKEIRLFVIFKALTNLEIHINNYLQKLGLDNWSIELSADSETKKGSIRKGFTVLVKSPFNNNLVPFKSWSGGESQRLRIAGTLGFASFIRDRKGSNWDMIVFDEPTAWLSDVGIDALLQVLKDYAKEERLTTFLIDHKDFSVRSVFDGIVNVVKDLNGSRFALSL